MLKRLKTLRGAEDGFTLVELLVVIVILGILSAVVVFSVRGITDTGPTAQLGGGTVNTYTVSSGAVAPLKLPGGASYAIPASNVMAIVAIGSSASDAVGVGLLQPLLGGDNAGLATDDASHLIVPISFTNTTVQPL